MATLPDLAVLIDSIRQGNEKAFRQLYEATKSRVFNTALSYVRAREDAEEITQDVFVEVFRAIGQFKGESSVLTWIYRITVNKSLDFQKRKKRQKRFAFFTSLFDSASGEVVYNPANFVHPGVILEKQEVAAQLFQAIAQLSDKQKTAYILSRVEGLSNIEVASVMDITVGAVESLLQRANENLKKQLASVYQSIVGSQ